MSKYNTKENVGNDEVLEESEYSRKTEFSKAVLASSQVERCLVARSKDMRPGYTTYVVDKNGESHPKIITDTRKEFVSSVEALKNLLSPEIKMKKSELVTNYQNKKKELFNKFAYHERLGKRINSQTGNVEWVFSKRLYMPQKGHFILADSEYPQSVKTVRIENGWEDNVDAYWDGMVEIADMLFQELNELIHQIEYFKGETSF